MSHGSFSPQVLQVNAEEELARITTFLRSALKNPLRKRGYVVAMSGGVDSSVVAALCVRAVGADNVLGLFLPEKHSSPDCLRLADGLAGQLGIRTVTETITGILDACGCYHRQEEAIRQSVPDFASNSKFKLAIASPLDGAAYRVTHLVTEAPGGGETHTRLSATSYREIVAATNFKQRIRKMLEYYHADSLGFAVTGTPNLLEYDQGFFVKNGDGAADVKPISHLYKTQVYQLAEFLEVPAEIRNRTPSTDTFPMEQSQEEFYFSLPYDRMDLCLYGKNHDVSPEEVAAVLDLTVDQVRLVYDDIDAKRHATGYLHLPPLQVP